MDMYIDFLQYLHGSSYHTHTPGQDVTFDQWATKDVIRSEEKLGVTVESLKGLHSLDKKRL